MSRDTKPKASVCFWFDTQAQKAAKRASEATMTMSKIDDAAIEPARKGTEHA